MRPTDRTPLDTRAANGYGASESRDPDMTALLRLSDAAVNL